MQAHKQQIKQVVSVGWKVVCDKHACDLIEYKIDHVTPWMWLTKPTDMKHNTTHRPLPACLIYTPQYADLKVTRRSPRVSQS